MPMEAPHLERVANNLDRSKQADALTPGEKILFGKYRESLAKYKIRERAFSDIYTPEEIREDENRVQRLKLEEKTKTERGELLEGIIGAHAEKSKWFGDKSRLVATSEYDDRVNHGDFVLELKTAEGKVVRILVDVTTSVDEKILNDKLKIGFKATKINIPNRVKYFQSKLEDFRGKLPTVPRVVIGISPSLLRELCGEILEYKDQQEKNPVQIIFLDLMENQLTTYWKMAASLYGNDQEITKGLKESLDLIRNISAKKESLRTHEYERKARQDRTSRLLRY